MSHITESRFRVRYAETDQMGVVYYANYFVWMEIGRTDFCRDCGFVYHDLEKEEDAFIAVAEASCRYVAPAKYDDMILVRTHLARLKRRVLEFTYSIHFDDQNTLLAEGKTVHVTIGLDGKPKSLPARYFELLTKFAE